ncbi:protein-disulfide reductase DsbD domain-containing protein, partial [Acidisphaera rubrifaciens]|uniref:protein-disulfide reductase DsbD domain-containing protein n=1 Tax=Acidisphaera rubrifaciens TaxID=50715 RepID=UPI000A9C50D7
MIRWPAICLLLLAATGITPAWALESAPVRSDRAVVTLITDTDHVAAGTQFRAGLQLRMAPGWHTYWRNPGDAGTTPELHLTLPAGVTAGPIDWPAPQILREGPVVTYSYEHEIVLPVTVTVARDAALPLHLAAHAEWLVCANICVPEQGDFTLDLPAGTPAPSAQAPLFAATDRLIPRPAPFTARVAPDGVLSVTG